MERGDKYKVAICNNAGSLAIYNSNKNIYLSPQADGPIEFNISTNEDIHLIQKSAYGKNFSIVEVLMHLNFSCKNLWHVIYK